MTWEEAITILQDKYDCCKSFYDLAAHPEEDYPEMAKYLQALQIALSALRPVSREQVEKMWKGEWIKERGQTYIPVEYNEQGEAILHDFVVYRCSICGRENTKEEPFCNCGAPMTDEAVEMVMERWREAFE